MRKLYRMNVYSCGKEYSVECYANIYKDEFKKLGYDDKFSDMLAKLAIDYSDGIATEIDLSSATEDLIDKINAIPEQYLVPVGDIHVYCTNCKHFRLDDEEIPYCPYEEKECDIRNCEDSRPFRERPMYESR